MAEPRTSAGRDLRRHLFPKITPFVMQKVTEHIIAIEIEAYELGCAATAAALHSTPAAPEFGGSLASVQPDAGLRDDLRGLLHEISGDLDARADSGDDISRDLGDRLRAALRSTPAAPTHTPKVMEAEAGRLLVESARIRAARLGPDDAHELRHLWAAINAGNSDPCGETCHLDADAIARWTEQYPKVMGLAALRPTPAAPLHPHDGYSYDGCKCVCCLNIRALATPAAQKPDAGLREALADQIATLYGWTAHEQASPRQRALYVLWREWHALVGERTEHPALSDERIESLSRQRAEECAALRSTPAAPRAGDFETMSVACEIGRHGPLGCDHCSCACHLPAEAPQPDAGHNCTSPCEQCGGGCDLGHTVDCPAVARDREPCAYCGSVDGETPSTAWHNDPLTGDTLRAAIAVASDLNNPRLSEVDWDFVAAYWSISIVRDYAETFGLTTPETPCLDCRADVLHEAHCRALGGVEP